MRLQPHQRVSWECYAHRNCKHVFRGTVIRPLLHDRYLIDDGLGLTPRVVPGYKLTLIAPRTNRYTNRGRAA